jgi:Outer membrane efflux protein
MNLRTLFFLVSLVLGMLFLLLSRAPANDHDLDPPEAPQNPQTKPYIAGPSKAKAVAGGINPTQEQVVNNQCPPAYLDLSYLVDLPSLLNCALERNPLTTTAWRQARAAAFSLSASKGAYWPNLGFTGGVAAKYNRTPDYPGYTRNDTADYLPQLQLQYLLFDFGGRDATVDTARFNLLATDLSINQTLQNVCAQVAAAYYNLLLQEAVLNLTEWQVEIATTIDCLTRNCISAAQTNKDNDAKDVCKSDMNVAADLQALLGADKNAATAAAKKLPDDFQAANKAHAIADSDAATALQGYQADQTRANLKQAQYQLDLQTKARDIARVQLLSVIG